MHKNIGEKFGIKYESRKKMKNPYHGITYILPDGEDFEQYLEWWKDTHCSKNHHLFDEVWSFENHCLSCDACGLIINIASIDTQYVKD